MAALQERELPLLPSQWGFWSTTRCRPWWRRVDDWLSLTTSRTIDVSS